MHGTASSRGSEGLSEVPDDRVGKSKAPFVRSGAASEGATTSVEGDAISTVDFDVALAVTEGDCCSDWDSSVSASGTSTSTLTERFTTSASASNRGRDDGLSAIGAGTGTGEDIFTGSAAVEAAVGMVSFALFCPLSLPLPPPPPSVAAATVGLDDVSICAKLIGLRAPAASRMLLSELALFAGVDVAVLDAAAAFDGGAALGRAVG